MGQSRRPPRRRRRRSGPISTHYPRSARWRSRSDFPLVQVVGTVSTRELQRADLRGLRQLQGRHQRRCVPSVPAEQLKLLLRFP